MKKQIAMGIAGLMMLGAASQASAAFNQGDLMMIGYNEATKEIGVNLGDVDFASLGATPTVLATGLDFSLASPAGETVSIGFFEDNSNFTTYAWDFYYATTTPEVSLFSNNWSNGMAFANNAQAVRSYYNNAQFGGADIVVADPGNANSYDVLMNMGSGVPGNYSGMNTINNVGEAQLGADKVEMYLYHFRSVGYTGMELVPSDVVAGQDWTAKLTLDNGTLTGVSEVPLPGTVLLFGSSLLGLMGIRRKNS